MGSIVNNTTTPTSTGSMERADQVQSNYGNDNLYNPGVDSLKGIASDVAPGQTPHIGAVHADNEKP